MGKVRASMCRVQKGVGEHEIVCGSVVLHMEL